MFFNYNFSIKLYLTSYKNTFFYINHYIIIQRSLHIITIFKEIKLNNKKWTKANTKFCLEKQKYVNKIICEYCNKIFYKQIDHTNHMDVCVELIKKELKRSEDNVTYFQTKTQILEQQLKDKDNFIQQQFEQIKTLQSQFATVTNKAVEKPSKTTHNNNKILNISVANFKDSDIQNTLENKFNTEYISDGQKGIARFG